jgi:hypothetical protein
MYDIRITQIGPIVTEPAVATQPSRVSIEVQTSAGQMALEMSPALAQELAETILRHLQDRGSQ